MLKHAARAVVTGGAASEKAVKSDQKNRLRHLNGLSDNNDLATGYEPFAKKIIKDTFGSLIKNEEESEEHETTRPTIDESSWESAWEVIKHAVLLGQQKKENREEEEE